MASMFVMSIRQGAELDHAFERNDWTPDDVKWLSKGDNLATILQIRRGTAKVVPVEPSQPASKPEPEPLLVSIGTPVVAPIGSPFIVCDHFVENTMKTASVKISCIWDNFREWFIKKSEPSSAASMLEYRKLSRSSVDGPIIEALGVEEKAETNLAEVFSLMQKQGHGEEGPLLTNGYANIFYIRDVAGVLRAVSVRWYGDGWNVHAIAVAGPYAWSAGNRVFSRNSR